MSTSLKKTCRTLRKQGLSLNEIVEITNYPKTTIYFHIKDIPLPPKAKERALRKAKERIINFNRSRKGKSALGRHPKDFLRWTPELVSLVCHLVFDGEINQSSCVYTNSNTCLIEKVRKLMFLVYDFEPKKIESTPGVFRISYNNVELATLLGEKSQNLMLKVSDMPLALKKSFLRAFFDDEGSVYFIGKKRLVRGYQHNFQTLELVQKLLSDFSIKSKVDKIYKEIIISRRENIVKFKDLINFSPGVKVNGNRSNSVWKQDLEKREILRRAIESYL